MQRRLTRKISLKDIYIGGDSPISIQSMTNTRTSDALSTIMQIKALEAAGCDIVRVSVPDIQSADALKEIISKVNIPVIEDIHFDYRIEIKSAENLLH